MACMDAERLAELLRLPDERPHVHGFHPYPARFSPLLVRGLLAEVPPGSRIFDPFAGSGTVPVEARLRGSHALANDLNPIAVLLCRVKATPLAPKIFDALERDLVYLRKYVAGRLASRDEAEHVKLPPGPRLFLPHVYWELQVLLGGIQRVRHPHNRDIFLAALSSIVNRVSLQARESQPERRLPGGRGGPRTAVLFYQQAERFIADLRLFSRQARDGSLRVWQADARDLGGIPDATADLVVTSPPYGGTYDYAAMHALRNVWLGMDWGPFEKLEIGARRHQAEKDALARLRADLQAVFTALRRVVRAGGGVWWVIADGVMAGKAYRAEELSAEVAEAAGWKVEAAGAVERPMWSEEEADAYAKRAKREHLMLFR